MAVVVMVEAPAHELRRRHSLWCDDCALPSAVEADFVWAREDTLLVVGHITIWQCKDCGRRVETETA